MAEIKDLSTTDANNTGTAANAGFPENMAYSDVNNAARALEGMIARLYADTNGTVTTTGSSNAYLLTPNQTVAAYAAGDRYVFKASFTNTGAVTINVSSLGAKSIVKPSGDALASGEIASGGLYEVIYDGTNFQMQGADDPENLTLTSLTVTGTTALNGNTTIGDAATDTVTITADVASDLIPNADGTHDLGAVGSEWQDLFIDGTANIDSLVADTADIDGGTVDGVVIGGASAAAGTFTTLVANTSLNIAGDGATVTGIKDEDNMASDSATKLATQQSIKAYVDSQVTAQDLDVISDSGNISVDLDSQSLTLTGGSGLDTSATGQTVTIAIDSTVATLTGSQTLTNKTLTAPVISTISNTGTITLPTATDTLVGRDTSDTLTNKTLTSAVLNTAVSGTAVLDEDDMSSNSSTQIATQQSIKAYVDSQVTAQDLDVTDGSSSIDIDLDSESLGILGGTGIDSTASGTGVTLAIDATVATLTGSQTLTNKTLPNAILNTGVSGTAILDEDNMASDSATQLATQQSIKAYVDSQVTAQDLDVTDGSSSIDIDLDSESLGILGGTGIDSTASGTGVTLAIDSTVVTLTGSQTLTNKSLTAPTLTGTAVVDTLDISGDIDVDGSTSLDDLNVELADNAASPVTMQQGGNSYFKIVTTNSSESVQLGNSTTNPDILLGGGNVGIGAAPAAARLEVTGAFGYASGANSLATAVSKAAARIRGSSDATTSLFFGSLTNDAEQYIQSSNGAGTGADDLVLNPYGGKVGIGNIPTDGALHVQTGSAGTVTASTQADDIVIENSAEGGMTIITPDDESARIRFTSPSTNTDVGGATIFYRQNINKMNIGTEVSGGVLQLQSGAGNATMVLDGSGNVGIGALLPNVNLEIMGSDSYDAKMRFAYGTSSANSYANWGYKANSDGNKIFLSIANGGTASDILVAQADGKVGINAAPYYPLHVTGGTVTNGEAKTNALFFDTTSATTGTGGGIALGGYSNGTSGDVYHFGNIQGIKENSTAGDYASALLFSTRKNGGVPTERMRISSAGAVTMPYQPAFLARPSVGENQDLAISTTLQVAFGTEIYDQDADFASNGFTAPVTGRYQFNASLYMTNLDSAASYYEMYLVTSNRTYYDIMSPYQMNGDLAYWNMQISVLADMDESDTAIVRIRQQGGTAQTDINAVSFFSGHLVA